MVLQSTGYCRLQSTTGQRVLQVTGYLLHGTRALQGADELKGTEYYRLLGTALPCILQYPTVLYCIPQYPLLLLCTSVPPGHSEVPPQYLLVPKVPLVPPTAPNTTQYTAVPLQYPSFPQYVPSTPSTH